MFISSKYADIVKDFLKKEIIKQKKKKLDDIMQFAGIMDGETKNLPMQELKSQKEEQ